MEEKERKYYVKRGRYAIMHFKELFELDGLDSNISENDIGRRNAISRLLDEWGLLKVIDLFEEDEPMANIGQIKIIAHKEKDEWELIPKYHIGNS